MPCWLTWPSAGLFSDGSNDEDRATITLDSVTKDVLIGLDQLRGKPPRSGGGQERGGEVARCRRARLCRVRIYSGVCCCSMYCRIMEIGAPPQLPAK